MTIVNIYIAPKINSQPKEINNLFEFFAPSINREFKGIAFTPEVEIYEKNNGINLKLEITGLDSKDLDIQATAKAVN